MKLVGQKPRGKSGTDLTLVVLLPYTNLEISRQNMNKLGKEILSVSGMDKRAIFFSRGGEGGGESISKKIFQKLSNFHKTIELRCVAV